MALPVDPAFLLANAHAPAPAAKVRDPAALRQTCKQFEAIFLHTLFKGMRSTVVDGGLLEKGSGTEIFQEMQDLEVANAAAERSTLGIGDLLYRQLLAKDAPPTK